MDGVKFLPVPVGRIMAGIGASSLLCIVGIAGIGGCVGRIELFFKFSAILSEV
jgi:hypothetical protein